MKRHLLLVPIAFCLTACSSTEKGSSSDGAFHKDVVLERIDGLTSRPSEIQESNPFRIDGGEVYSLGITTINDGDRLEAAFRVADNSAKALIATAIQQKLNFIFENGEEGTGESGQQSRYIGSEVSKITSSNIRISKRYWEKIGVTDQSGARKIQYRVFSMVSMPEAQFKSAIAEAVKRGQSQGKVSPEFAKKLDKHWDEITKDTSDAEESGKQQ